MLLPSVSPLLARTQGEKRSPGARKASRRETPPRVRVLGTKNDSEGRDGGGYPKWAGKVEGLGI